MSSFKSLEILVVAILAVLASPVGGGGDTDCNGNGWPDDSDLAHGVSQDCNGNAVPDECDIASGTSQDCEPDGVPDECGVDCNGNGLSDSCDIASGTSQDCDADDIPDECGTDCNGNGFADSCDLGSGSSDDCNANGIPDECDSRIRLEPRYLYQWTASSRAGDMDNDGDFDIVTVHQVQAWWWENKGAGLFEPAQSIGSGWGYAEVADLNSDGNLDVLVSEGAHLLWYENLGDGAFGAVIPIALEQTEGTWPIPVAVADLDGDSDLDILHIYSWQGPQNTGHLLVWYENLDGEASFGPPHVLYEGEESPWYVQAADVDGDGDSDVLCGHVGQLVWHENDGSGSFTSHHLDDGWVPSVVGNDIDGDGDTDVLAVVRPESSYELVWYRNLGGTGQFGPAQVIAGDVGITQANLIDFDRDGDLDALVISGEHEDLRWYENLDGRGTFGPAMVLMSEGDHYAHQLPIAVDIDGDVDLDVMTYKLTWLENVSDDCDGNGVPDSCEADCNASGIVDACDISGGISVDCDANVVPDECDAACTGCNADEDLCLDELDCAPEDASVWADPGFVTNLRLQGDGPTELSWQPPVFPGAASVRYDTLRSDSPGDFFVGTACLDSDGADTVSEDGDALDSGELFYYLIRVENECPGSSGSMGEASDGTPHSGIVCF